MDKSIQAWREDRALRGDGNEWRWPAVFFGIPLSGFSLFCAVALTVGGDIFSATLAWASAAMCILGVIRLWTVRDRWEEEYEAKKE